VQSFTDGSYASFQTNLYNNVVLGLNDNSAVGYIPTGDFSTQITYALWIQLASLPSNTAINIYVSGIKDPYVGSWVVGDRFSIKHDGFNVRFFKNGALIAGPYARSSSVNPLYLDTRIFESSTTLSNLVFGPASSAGTAFKGDLLGPPYISGRFGPLFYDRTQLNQVTAGPYYWSYRIDLPNAPVINSGTSSSGYPAGTFIGPWTAAPPSPFYYDNYTYEPPGLSMFDSNPDPPNGPNRYFVPKIAGIYLINISISAGFNSFTSVSLVETPSQKVLAYSIGVRLGGNCASFIVPMNFGSAYLFLGGGQSNGAPFTLLAGTQAQFYLLSPS
jgi:hypothetical protein